MPATIYKSNIYGAPYPAITPVGNEPVTRKATVSIPITTTLTDGDLLDLALIPAGAEILSLTLFSGDLDEGTALVFDVGLREADDTALETVFVSGSTLGQAGGTLAAPATTTMFTTGVLTADKILSIEIKTTAGAACAAAAKIGAVFSFKMA